MSQSVFAVIPSWNLKDDLMECVASVLESNGQQVRVVVVDSASTDGTHESVHARFGKAVKVIRCPENLGFAHAANRGLNYAVDAGARYILVLNNDTVVHESMVDRLTQAMAQRPDVGIVGPVIYYADSPDRVWRAGDRQFLGPPFVWKVSQSRIKSDPLHVDYVTGCAMLVARDVFEAIGGFAEDYRMYFEDADFCQRAREAGFQILVVPSATMRHKVSLSTQGVPSSRAYYQARGRVIFLNRHSPYLLIVVANLYIWARLLVETGWQVLKGRAGVGRAKLAGAIAGYAHLVRRMPQE
jgi:hypothetical protein